MIDKAVLSQRTNEYQGWVEAYARNQCVRLEWAEPKARKEDYVRPAGERVKRAGRHARRFGSAMMSNTDSTLFIYSTGHMLVRVYERSGQRFQKLVRADEARVRTAANLFRRNQNIKP